MKDRDSKGRLLPGHSLKSPGNPNLARLGAAQRAVREAATPEDVTAVLAAMHKRAVAGDAQAASVWLTRVLGKPDTAQLVDVGTDLGGLDLGTAAGIAEASRHVVHGVLAGVVAVDAAERVAALLAQVGQATAWRDLAERVEQLESSHSGRTRIGVVHG